ncbi:MAG: FtsX-like permease family protein, partial [Streptococcaceae bacterium]|nr:FtsX-like permease family protein [Streptococcaceae bacterium]
EVKSEPKKNSEQYFNQQIMNTEQINLIYTTNKAAIDFTKRQMELYADQPGMQEEIARSEDEGNFYQPIYVLKSPEDVVAFRQEVQPLLPDYYIVNDSTEQYDQIGGSLKKMSQISSYVVIVATVATLAIISLVVLLFMRDRKHELGVYLSLGESRGKVIGQIVLETLVVSLLALLISLVTGNLLGSAVSNSLISSDLFGSPNSGGMMMGGALYNPMLSSEDVMQAYQVTFSTGYIFSFLGLGLLTVALSTIAPLTYISRLNPKKIMM